MNVFSEAVTMKSSYGEAGNGVLRRFLAMRKKECRVNKAELSRKKHTKTRQLEVS
jgi:hypothetical protein